MNMCVNSSESFAGGTHQHAAGWSLCFSNILVAVAQS